MMMRTVHVSHAMFVLAARCSLYIMCMNTIGHVYASITIYAFVLLVESAGGAFIPLQAILNERCEVVEATYSVINVALQMDNHCILGYRTQTYYIEIAENYGCVRLYFLQLNATVCPTSVCDCISYN